jgi:hypothetical protein
MIFCICFNPKLNSLWLNLFKLVVFLKYSAKEPSSKFFLDLSLEILTVSAGWKG